MNPHSPPTRTGLNLKSFQSWHWIFLAAILLAAIAISTFYFSSAQAQTADGTITGLTLTSDSPGTLTVSWDAANPTPTDYRVDWAKSPESYQSWKVDEGHVYPVATATSTTITGLEHDTEYKIRLRARYYRGEHEGKSWGGPWAEATITVAGQPAEPVQQPPKEEPVQQQPRDDPDPPAGTIETLTAADDTGQLLLTWTTPPAPNSDPTDYHVNWAKSTEEYPANTAEAGNAHPTGTTHTLAGLEFDTDYKIHVRARYSDGENAANPWNGPWTETTAQVKLPLPAAPFIGAIAVSPDREVLLTWFNSEENNSITGYQVLRGPDADSLAVIEDDTGSTSTSYTDETPPAGQTHTYGVKARNASGLSPLSDTVEATVPAAEEEEELITASQTAADNTLVSNLGSPASELQFSAQRNVDRRRYAQTFSAANNADGTQAKFDFEGLTFQLSGSDIGNVAASHLVVTVNADNSGEPGSVLNLLTSATTSLSLHHNRREFTFNAPTGATLTSGVTYWLVFAAAPGSDYFDRNYISLALTQDDGEVQGTETVNHWSIGDTSLYDTGSAISQTEQRVVMVAVLGLQLAAPLVSNLGQTTGTPISTDYDERSAQAFVAAPGPFDFGYRFQGIRVSARGLDVFEELHIPQVRASLHGDSGGIPGARLHTLTIPLDFASTETFTDYTLLAPPGTVLRGGARYWVVFEVLDNTLYLEGTNSADEDPRLDAWSIDNYSYTNTKQSSGWVSVTRVTDAIPRVIKLAVLGSPQWVTNEADGPDLPGAGHNAHQTIGVVTPGIVSTGHLTPGLDRNHGLTGDYWWLETQRGHSYRVEVKFGDNPDNDTGGSAWMSFIDPDHDDYPYASGCCEADHNRNDGHTFVHFYRPTDDWNNHYLINVAAFDKLNSNSRTYNGPYTITMTDITGTREFVSNLYQDSRSDLLEVGAARQYAIFFETGHHAAGYKLDRIQTFITDQGSPEFSLYSNTIDVPGTKLCDFRNPRQVQHHVTWSAGPPAITFLAPDCAEITLMPTRSAGMLHTYYWIVMEGTNYRLSGMDSYAESAYGPGWRIGDLTVTKTTASWLGDPNSKIIPISVWLSER